MTRIFLCYLGSSTTFQDKFFVSARLVLYQIALEVPSKFMRCVSLMRRETASFKFRKKLFLEQFDAKLEMNMTNNLNENLQLY